MKELVGWLVSVCLLCGMLCGYLFVKLDNFQTTAGQVINALQQRVAALEKATH
jgi:hypothetical protein